MEAPRRETPEAPGSIMSLVCRPPSCAGGHEAAPPAGPALPMQGHPEAGCRRAQVPLMRPRFSHSNVLMAEPRTPVSPPLPTHSPPGPTSSPSPISASPPTARHPPSTLSLNGVCSHPTHLSANVCQTPVGPGNSGLRAALVPARGGEAGRWGGPTVTHGLWRSDPALAQGA